MQSTTGSRALDTGLTPLGTCSRGADPPPGGGLFCKGLGDRCMETRKALTGAREVFGTGNSRRAGGAYYLPAREAVFCCSRICPQSSGKRDGKSGKFLEGGRIYGENMG